MNAPRTPVAAPQATVASPTLRRTPPPLRVPATPASRTLAPAVRTPAGGRPPQGRPRTPAAEHPGGFLDGPRRQANAVLSADVPGWDLLTTVVGHEVRRDMGTIAHRLLHLEHSLGPRLYQRLTADGFLPRLIQWVEEHTRDIHLTVPVLRHAFEQAWEDSGLFQSAAENLAAVKNGFDSGQLKVVQ
jgi:hypothetical protein